eukprot:361278-Chlamydomonas_euryale.AAC.13
MGRNSITPNYSLSNLPVRLPPAAKAAPPSPSTRRMKAYPAPTAAAGVSAPSTSAKTTNCMDTHTSPI